MNENSTTRFITSLAKSIQTLCHGYVDFEKNIEIIGHIYLNVDSQQKFDYIVNEQVCKNDQESSAQFFSNSFHAQPTCKAGQVDQDNFPLDLKIHPVRDVTIVDLSNFQPGPSDTGQGRSVSPASSHSLSAGSESGSLGCNAARETASFQNQNHDGPVPRRKRHSNGASKLSPNISPPHCHWSEEGRTSGSSPRLQYTIGASASKLARRISNELERQGTANPRADDSEIHSRLSGETPSCSERTRKPVSRMCDGSFKTVDMKYDPDNDTIYTGGTIDLSRVKEEVTEEEVGFIQVPWNRAGREDDHDPAFPRTGPDDPAAECGQYAAPSDQDNDDELSGSSLYPVMIHQNTAGLPVSGYGSPVFPQNFVELSSHTASSTSSPVASTSGQLSPGSAFTSRRGQPSASARAEATANFDEFVRPLELTVCPDRYSHTYRDKLKQENPERWMSFKARAKERIKRERAILRDSRDEESLIKKEKIRIQNRLRKRKERQRKREQAMLMMLKGEMEADCQRMQSHVLRTNEYHRTDNPFCVSDLHHATFSAVIK